MDYRVFQRGNDYPVTLSAREIGQPFLALQTFLASTSKQHLHQDFDNLLYAQFKLNKWRELGAPAYLYGTHRRLIKLMDILWLIAQCYRGKFPTHQDSFEERSLKHQFYKRSFRNLFVDHPLEIEEIPEVDALSAVIRFFDECSLYGSRGNIGSWVEVALSSSYMGNLNLDFFVTECGMMRVHRMIAELIDAAYQLETMEMDLSMVNRLNMYKIFAYEIDYPASFEEMEIDDPCSTLVYPSYYMDLQLIPQAVNTWYKMLASVDHWQHHNDPGNIIYFKNTLMQQVEASWLLLQDYDSSCFVQARRKDKDCSYLNALEYANPFQVIEQFFEARSLSTWKLLLEEWAYGSLTDKKEEGLLDSKITKHTCEQLIKLMQALSLINKRNKKSNK